MVKSLRAALRAALFLLWSGLCLLVRLLLRPLTLALPRCERPVRDGIARCWARGVAGLIGLRITVHGQAPAPPFLLVTNHLGYIDIVTLMACAPAVFVSRGDLSGWPVLGTLARSAGTLFIDRSLKRDVMRINMLMGAVLAGGQGLIMFPEGTSSDGSAVLTFRSSLFQPAVELAQPVSWASLGYRTPEGQAPAGTSVCWWGDMTFVDHFWRLLQLPHINAQVSFGAAPLRHSDRHELSRAAQAAVTDQLATRSEEQA